MKAVFVLALLCVIVSPALCDIWTNCGTAGDDLTITSVTISPDPPTKGSNLTVSVVGTMNTQVTTGSYVQLKVKYGIITIINQKENLCGAPSPIACPINTGPWKQAVSVNIDNSVPSGSYSASAEFTDQNGKQIACVNVAFDLK
eukprot:Phypoly_transcript_24239.p1 GENE.Phypoly_transcript_24239~~Phypoly_transcript_24239.p1  ORF type:complete len:169 (+),score=16.80 Phypoly_transcript_24239:76-507(+)